MIKQFRQNLHNLSFSELYVFIIILFTIQFFLLLIVVMLSSSSSWAVVTMGQVVWKSLLPSPINYPITEPLDPDNLCDGDDSLCKSPQPTLLQDGTLLSF